MEGKRILDACCGSRMFWYDKNNPDVCFMDIRKETCTLCDGRTLTVDPDVIADFTDMPFEDASFSLVVFDPPHLLRAGETGWLRKKYGVLPKDWRPYLRKGFGECMRVLKPDGVLVMKWNTDQIPATEVLKAIGHTPLFGDKRAKTRFFVFMKQAGQKEMKESEEGNMTMAEMTARKKELDNAIADAGRMDGMLIRDIELDIRLKNELGMGMRPSEVIECMMRGCRELSSIIHERMNNTEIRL